MHPLDAENRHASAHLPFRLGKVCDRKTPLLAEGLRIRTCATDNRIASAQPGGGRRESNPDLAVGSGNPRAVGPIGIGQVCAKGVVVLATSFVPRENFAHQEAAGLEPAGSFDHNVLRTLRRRPKRASVWQGTMRSASTSSATLAMRSVGKWMYLDGWFWLRGRKPRHSGPLVLPAGVEPAIPEGYGV